MLVALGNLSAWVGGAVGRGQIREAIAVSVFEIEVGEAGCTIPTVLTITSDSITSIIKGRDPKAEPDKSEPELVLAQTRHTSEQLASLLSMKQKIEWKISYKPQQIALSWISTEDKAYHNPNEILDHISNVFRYVRVEAQFTHTAQQNTNDAGQMRVSVLCYKETPAIMWVDEEVEELSTQISTKLEKMLKGHETTGRAEACWMVKKVSNFVLRKWQPVRYLEQYSKNTYAIRDASKTLNESRFEFNNSLPNQLFNEFIEVPSFFGKVRGRIYIFLTFLIGQVMLGFFINWLSSRFF